MPKGLTFLTALAVAAWLPFSAVAESAPTIDTVVARVNGEEITLGHMIIAHAILPEQYQQLPPDVLYTAILDQLIQQNALKQSRTGAVPRHVEISLENERRSLLAADAIETIMAGAASDDEIRAAYDAQYADGFGDDEFNASHILVESESEAAEIREALTGGGDFANLAKEKSTGPSGPSGGELGWFGAGAMVPEFETAVVALEPGEVSEPVQTQFGWHVIKLNETRKKTAPEFDAVREELANTLRKDAVDAQIDALTAAATIERPVVEGLQPEILRNLDLVRN